MSKISKLIMQTELDNKHHEKRKLRKEIRSTGIKLKSTLDLILFNALLHQLNVAIKSSQKSSKVVKVDRSPLFTTIKEIMYFTNKQKQHVSMLTIYKTSI